MSLGNGRCTSITQQEKEHDNLEALDAKPKLDLCIYVMALMQQLTGTLLVLRIQNTTHALGLRRCGNMVFDAPLSFPLPFRTNF